MQEADGAALGRHLHGCRHVRGRDGGGAGARLIDDQRRLRLRRRDVPIDVDDSGRLLEHGFHLAGELQATRRIRTVDFRDERLQHRRPRRHFRHLNRGVEPSRDRHEPIAHALGDVVALLAALVFRREIDLEVGEVRAAAEKVVTHQAVEVVRRRQADVALHVDDARVLQDFTGELRRDARRLLEGRALGHVHDHLELALVVERQHLDGDELERHERHRREQQDGDAGQKCQPHPAVPDEAGHRAAIQPRGRAFRRMAVSALGPKQADGGPRRDHERGRQREQHRRGRAHRNRPHVGAHQAADERHRQNRGDDGEGRENRRIADLVDGADRHRRRGLTHPPPACGRAGRCSPRRRSHRRRGCRSRRSRQRA